MAIIHVENLSKRYPSPDKSQEDFYAVKSLSLSIQSGEIFGLLGPNGAGKTTTLEMIEGLTEIDEGVVEICGIDARKKPFDVRQLIGVQLQSNDYFDKLSLLELLQLFSGLYRSKVDGLSLLDKVNLADKAKALPSQLSGGQKQRFSIACALVNTPKVLFLDEPTTGLDPQAKRNLWELVKSLNADGMTIVITTHNMEEAEYLCNRIGIMEKGELVAQGEPQALILEYAPEPPEAPLHGNLEDVFLHLTGSELRD
ncbi:MAG: ABC-2 type transport system ATP-binding protein [Flavobacteriales bacterium]|jgi:ABC-2 type transport system ATP-binding protein